MAALLLGGERSGRFSTQRGGGMQSAWTSKCSGCTGSLADAGSAHDRLAWTYRAAIYRLTRDGRRTSSRHTWTRRTGGGLTRSGTSLLLLLQPRDHIGTRRHDRTSGGLSSQWRSRLRAKGCSWYRRCGSRGRWLRCSGRSSGSRLSGQRNRCRRRRSRGRCGSRRRRCGSGCCRQWLPRSRQYLAGARRRRRRTRGDRASAQRRMQRHGGCAG